MKEVPVVYLTREVPEEGINHLREQCKVVTWEESTPPPQDHLIDRLAELKVDGLFCNVSDEVDATVIDASPKLTAIGTMSVGYDHIDLKVAAERGIAVGHTPGVLSETTADLGWSLLMAGARRIVEANEQVHDGKWDTWGPKILLGRDVHDATLGVVGLGGIGTAFARRAAGFDMDVCYSHTSRSQESEAELAEYGIDARYCELPTLLEQSDFVSLHVPLLDDTYHLVAEEELQLMRDEAVLVNTARGEIVDTDALDTALEKGWIRHAALDVTDPEPIPSTHPLLRHAPEKLTITPHIGSASMQTRAKMAEMTSDNILAGLRGERPPNSALADAGLR